jgi:predicted nucleotide-binding protein (sugar kinase/HSP70/actin superfamily)
VTIKVGIPRALLYYRFYPLWKTFFTELGVEVVVSGSTNQEVFRKGRTKFVGETCLPMQLAFGHVMTLIGKVDYLFIPRLVSIERDTYLCPHFAGLPDVLYALIPDLPPLLDTHFNVMKKGITMKSIYEAGKRFTKNPLKIFRAYQKAQRRQEKFLEEIKEGITPQEAIKIFNGEEIVLPEKEGEKLNIALVGNPYTLYDPFSSLDIVQRLRKLGARIYTSEMLPDEIIEERIRTLSKRIYWTFGKETVGAAFHFLDSPKIDGLIYVISFACGPDSLLKEIVDDKTRKDKRVAYMSLVIDEHTGTSGVETRLDAFIEMIKRRRSKKPEERR